jgi:hypothetical protein
MVLVELELILLIILENAQKFHLSTPMHPAPGKNENLEI